MTSHTIIIPNEVLLNAASQELAAGHDVTLPVKGESMLPFIRGDRDRVVVRRESSYNKGEIVLAQLDNGNFVLHRIILMQNGVITLMGDGNLQGREQCHPEQIAGRVIALVRKGKRREYNTPSQRLLAWIWIQLCPLRRYLLILYRIL